MRNSHSNLIITLLFIVLNPLYALFITTVYSIITNRVSNLLIGILYVLSFSLIFSNQIILSNSDLGGYLTMFQKTGEWGATYVSYFEEFFANPLGREFLWFFYCKFIGGITNYSYEAFTFITYMMIFSLSAYLAFLVCESGRYNFSLMLFALIFFEMTFIDTGYDLWRNIVSILIFFVGVMKYFSSHSRLISRILIYSSVFIHITTLPVLCLFELYALFMNRNNQYVSLKSFVSVKIILMATISIILGLYVSGLIVEMFGSNINNPIYKGINLFKEIKSNEFNFLKYMRPFYIMFIAYIALNWKNVSHFDIFIIFIFIVIQFLDHLTSNLAMVFSRASIANYIGILFITMKLFERFDYTYTVAFVFLIFILRMNYYSDSSNLFFLDILANGELLNPIYGLLYSIFYFYNPSFTLYLLT